MKQSLLLLIGIAFFASCSKSLEDKAEVLIKKELMKSLYKPDTYNPIETSIDSAFSPRDNPALFDKLQELMSIAKDIESNQFDQKQAKSSMSIWSGPYQTAFGRNEYNEAKEDYEKVEQRPLWLPKHYMVYFDLAGDPFCSETAKKISKIKNIPILNLAGKFKRWARYNYLTPTPEQWLYILHHADYICTNSFHGVAFSIIYRQPFVCCAAQVGGRQKTNGRVQNLLDQANLGDRYITDFEGAKKIIENEIKFDGSAIEAYRNRSLQWLKNAIDNETDKK